MIKFISYMVCSTFLITIGCKKNIADPKLFVDATYEVLDICVKKDQLVLNQNEGKWYYRTIPFNGFAITYHANGKLKEKIGYYKGKKEGVAKKWFDNGLLQKESFYIQNHLDGKVTVWWSNGKIASQARYINGVRDGVQQKWFQSGSLAKKTYLENGKENGMQQAWLENGKIYVNYEARNGRVFGLQRADLCYQLKKEKIKEKYK
ncbi:hypothetical protein GCM10022393_38800 [Aquimarina addita]|uniref:Toxin-antitoxin system YwqK family antitoxin n=1 Tax=Aquimarina addita TaxID=870485 RepID=A0ABP6UVC6_9FLAO